MGRTLNISSMNTEFEDFLFAAVGEQKNGMTVSIFSALSRLDIDPWREAKRLSDLPKDRAIQALRGSIERLSDLQWTKIDAAGLATSLIRLLPKHGGQVKPRAPDEDVIRPGRVAQPSLSSGLLSRAAGSPAAVWLAIGVLVMVMTYISWFGGSPSFDGGSGSPPSSYDSPAREEPRR